MVNEPGRTPRQETRKFIFMGYRVAPVAMFLTLQSIAISVLFWYVISNSNRAIDLSEQTRKETREDAKENMKTVIEIFRPEIQQIKEYAQQAKENVDTVKDNAINKNKRN